MRRLFEAAWPFLTCSLILTGCSAPTTGSSPAEVNVAATAPPIAASATPSAPRVGSPRDLQTHTSKLRLVVRRLLSSDLRESTAVEIDDPSVISGLLATFDLDRAPSSTCPVCAPIRVIELLDRHGQRFAVIGLPCGDEPAPYHPSPERCESLVVRDRAGLERLFATHGPEGRDGGVVTKELAH